MLDSFEVMAISFQSGHFPKLVCVCHVPDLSFRKRRNQIVVSLSETVINIYNLSRKSLQSRYYSAARKKMKPMMMVMVMVMMTTS